MEKTYYSKEASATFELRPFKLHKLENGPAKTTTLTINDALKLYENMTMIRRLEIAIGSLYMEKIIRGFCHLYVGQEAVAVGMHNSLRSADTVITGYRCHGWSYLMGLTPSSMMAELTGKKSGCCRGKGGSMHLFCDNFYGGNGIVGAQVPLGVGLAFAHKYKGDGGVNFALFGDGAANQGQIFEVYNIAKLWSLPCVFVCENNGYGMGTSASRASACVDYYTRGDFIPGIWVDGMDVLTTREATKFAIEHCVSGKGPILMEMETYRYSGHSMSDPGTSYRSREEVQSIRQKRDPINTFKEKIIAAKLATPDKLNEIDGMIRKVVDDAIKTAKEDKEIGTEELAGDVYFEPYNDFVRGIHPGVPLKHVKVEKRQ